jgi:3-methyladenine DNA glycosylase AlkD
LTDLADDAFARVQGAFTGGAQPERARAMAAYMRDQFPFLGLTAPEQRCLAAGALHGVPAPSEADIVAFTTSCWAANEREFQYAGCDYAVRYVARCTPAFLDHARILITTKSWWDTVDALASRVVGGLVAAHRSLAATMDDWVGADDIWLARTAILHQLTYKAHTDADRLFRYCEQRAAGREFFLRKAIGWALREYSKTDPGAVRAFVDNHAELSPLSRREALRWLERQGAMS